MRRQILMGGSPSTGSSVLVNILNRHALATAGAETYLFIHPRLFTDWRRRRRFLLRTSRLGGLKSEGWFQMNGAKLLHPDYGWSAPELTALVESSRDFPTFAETYMARRRGRTGAQIWVEKSPANALTFPHFLDVFPAPGVIHTIRDPYDTVASLCARGQTPYQAAGAYVVHTALVLRVWGQPAVHCVRYEELAFDPAATVRRLFDFLQCAWDESVLEPSEEERAEEVRMAGWLQNEKARVGTASVGRFQRLPATEQRKLSNALALFRINPAFAQRHGLQHTTLRSMASNLGYPYREPEQPDRAGLKGEMRRDQWSRAGRLYPAFGQNYPGGLLF